MVLTDRDSHIIYELLRWNGCTANQIKKLAKFTTNQFMYRRLKTLTDNNIITKKRYVYGIPSIYTATKKGQRLVGSNLDAIDINIGTLQHNLAVIDTYIIFKSSLGLDYTCFKSDREIRKDRNTLLAGHLPDFSFTLDDENTCVEVELSLKSEMRLRDNIGANFINYDKQIWVVKNDNKKLLKLLEKYSIEYPNIEVLLWENIYA